MTPDLVNEAEMGDNDHMGRLFAFFFRLLLAFLAARFLARFLGLEGLAWLVGLTLAFLGNLYLFDYYDHRGRSAWRRLLSRRPAANPPSRPVAPEPPPET